MKANITKTGLIIGCGLLILTVGCKNVAPDRRPMGSADRLSYVDTMRPHRATVWRVDDVHAMLQKTDPPQVLVKVRGQTTSSGWTNPEFVPFVYVNPPKDGIYEFMLTADRPGGIVLPVLTDFNAELVWRNPPPDIRGVRIHAVENRKDDNL
jgi:hypothetical protein